MKQLEMVLPETNVKQDIIVLTLKCYQTNPETSHPNRYWKQDSNKFIAIYHESLQRQAKFIIVNYKTHHSKYRILTVNGLNLQDLKQPLKTKNKTLKREEFKTWWQKLNTEHNIVKTIKQ